MVNTPLNAVVGGGILKLANASANTIGSSSSFTVNGGTLSIEGPNNTGSASLTATTAGTIIVGGPDATSAAGTAVNASSVTVNTGGTFSIDNSFTAITDRLSNTAPISLNGGSFTYIGNTAAVSTETIGAITLGSGNSQIKNTINNDQAITVTSASLTRNVGATVNFLGQGLGTAANQLKFTSDPSGQLVGNDGGIFRYATIGNSDAVDFATYDVALGVKAFTAYKASLIDGMPRLATP